MHSSVGPFGKSLLSLLDIMDCVRDDDTPNEFTSLQIQMWNTKKKYFKPMRIQKPRRHNGLCTRWWYTKWIYILIVEQIQMWNTRRKTISNKWENRNLLDINGLWTIIQNMYFHITNTTWLYKMYKYKRYIYKSSTSLSWALVHFDF